MKCIRFHAVSRPFGGDFETHLRVAECPFLGFDLEVPTFSAILFCIRNYHPLRGVFRRLELMGSPNSSP